MSRTITILYIVVLFFVAVFFFALGVGLGWLLGAGAERERDDWRGPRRRW